MTERSYHASRIGAWLTDSEHADRAATKAAAREIAACWNDRYLFASWTRRLFEKCVR